MEEGSVISLLVVTTFAPQSTDESTPRGRIFKLFCNELETLARSKNLKALLIGPKTDSSSNQFIEFIESDLVSKEEKLRVAHGLVAQLGSSFKYICRLDDDDFLNGEILDDLNGDFVVDSKHSFYDLVSAKFACQTRPWFPNTTIIRREIALSEPWTKGKSLFFHYNHSIAWHKYAQEGGFKVQYCNRPIYIRLLTPFSITSSQVRDGTGVRLLFSKREYFFYRAGFGVWEEGGANLKFFPIKALNDIWLDFFDEHFLPNWKHKVYNLFKMWVIRFQLKRL